MDVPFCHLLFYGFEKLGTHVFEAGLGSFCERTSTEFLDDFVSVHVVFADFEGLLQRALFEFN